MTNVVKDEIYRDNDPRRSGRTIKIDGFELKADGFKSDKAVCSVVTQADSAKNYKKFKIYKTKIALSRFKPTKNGYTLLTSVPTTAPVTPLPQSIKDMAKKFGLDTWSDSDDDTTDKDTKFKKTNGWRDVNHVTTGLKHGNVEVLLREVKLDDVYDIKVLVNDIIVSSNVYRNTLYKDAVQNMYRSMKEIRESFDKFDIDLMLE